MLRAQAAQNFETVDSGKADIQHDQIERRLRRFVQSRFAIVNQNRIMAHSHHSRSNLSRQSDFIVDNEDAHKF
jgi:hypothetical protein